MDKKIVKTWGAAQFKTSAGSVDQRSDGLMMHIAID
jgi:hypothetical protein